MAQTIRWPIERTPTGGAALTETPAEATAQCVALSMVPGQSANPWEVRDGIGAPGSAYEVQSPALSAEERAFASGRFGELSRQRRAALNGEPEVAVDGGFRRIVVNYTDLETGSPAAEG